MPDFLHLLSYPNLPYPFAQYSELSNLLANRFDRLGWIGNSRHRRRVYSDQYGTIGQWLGRGGSLQGKKNIEKK